VPDGDIDETRSRRLPPRPSGVWHILEDRKNGAVYATNESSARRGAVATARKVVLRMFGEERLRVREGVSLVGRMHAIYTDPPAVTFPDNFIHLHARPIFVGHTGTSYFAAFASRIAFHTFCGVSGV
jgi:hypothetical protein